MRWIRTYCCYKNETKSAKWELKKNTIRQKSTSKYYTSERNFSSSVGPTILSNLCWAVSVRSSHAKSRVTAVISAFFNFSQTTSREKLSISTVSSAGFGWLKTVEAGASAGVGQKWFCTLSTSSLQYLDVLFVIARTIMHLKKSYIYLQLQSIMKQFLTTFEKGLTVSKIFCNIKSNKFRGI